MDSTKRKKSYKIPQCDGNGYDKDDDYAATTEEESDSSESSDEDDLEPENEVATSSKKSRISSSSKILPPPAVTKRVTRQRQQPNNNKKETKQKPQPNKRRQPQPQKPSTEKVSKNKVLQSKLRSLIKSKMMISKENTQEEEETEETNFQCPKCQKGFATNVCLGKHLYWCNSSRITRSRTGDGIIRKTKPKPIKNVQKGGKRGRKPKNPPKPLEENNPEEEETLNNASAQEMMMEYDEDNYENVANNEESPQQSPIHRYVESTDESDYEAKLASTTLPNEHNNYELEESVNVVDEHDDDDEDNFTTNIDTSVDEGPSICPSCKMTYRNHSSLEKHLSSCMYTSTTSSSEDEDDEEDIDDANADNNLIPSTLAYDDSKLEEERITPPQIHSSLEENQHEKSDTIQAETENYVEIEQKTNELSPNFVPSPENVQAQKRDIIQTNFLNEAIKNNELNVTPIQSQSAVEFQPSYSSLSSESRVSISASQPVTEAIQPPPQQNFLPYQQNQSCPAPVQDASQFMSSSSSGNTTTQQLPLMHYEVVNKPQNLNSREHFSTSGLPVKSPYGLGQTQMPINPLNQMHHQSAHHPNNQTLINNNNMSHQQNPETAYTFYPPSSMSMPQQPSQNYGSNPWLGNSGLHHQLSSQHLLNPGGSLSNLNSQQQQQQTRVQPQIQAHQMVSFQDANGQIYRMSIPVPIPQQSSIPTQPPLHLPNQFPTGTELPVIAGGNPCLQLLQQNGLSQYPHLNIPQQQQQINNLQNNQLSQYQNQFLKQQQPYNIQQHQAQFSHQNLPHQQQPQISQAVLDGNSGHQLNSEFHRQLLQQQQQMATSSTSFPHAQHQQQLQSPIFYDNNSSLSIPAAQQQQNEIKISQEQQQSFKSLQMQQHISQQNLPQFPPNTISKLQIPQQQESSQFSGIQQQHLSPPQFMVPKRAQDFIQPQQLNCNIGINSTTTSTQNVPTTNVQNSQIYSPRTNGNILNQPYQMVQMPDGNTYLVVPSQPPENIGQSNPQMTAAQIAYSQPQQTVENFLQPPGGPSTNTVPYRAISSNSTTFQDVQNHHIPCLSSNSSSAQPCPCPRCCIRVVANTVADKYRKVLPFPRPIEPKQTPNVAPPRSEEIVTGFVKTYMKRPLSKTIKTQLASMIMERQQGSGPLPPSASTFTSPTNIPLTNTNERQEIVESSTPFDSQQNSSRKLPVLTAVVRPMEHPLQKMSDQISQIEYSFNSSSSISSIRESPEETQAVISISTTQVPPDENMEEFAEGPPQEDSQSQNNTTTTDLEITSIQRISSSAPSTPTRKRKAVSLNNNSPAKGIKLILEKKRGTESNYIVDIRETGGGISQGHMTHLKIKKKIMSGPEELIGTFTDVEIVPKIHMLPYPHFGELNHIIAEHSTTSPPSQSSNDVENPITKDPSKLSKQLVVKYVINKNNSTELKPFETSDVRAVWSNIFDTESALDESEPPLTYPVQYITIDQPESTDSTQFLTNYDIKGLTHEAVQFLLDNCISKKKNDIVSTEDSEDFIKTNVTGCARTEGYSVRKSFDMFGWLASRHRTPLEMIPTAEESMKTHGMAVTVPQRTVKEKTEMCLTVMWSTINGRGLYTRRPFKKGDMIIEYAGEVIRSIVCDRREKNYQTKGIGCYMFRINDEYVIDATMKGNAARFINHSCDPNCESKSIKILGTEHILIYALRTISSGEELTYDYKFEKEEDKHKIPCKCASKKCRKFLN